jgi:hypothetical protein
MAEKKTIAWFSYVVQYAETEKSTTRKKSFKHDGSTLDSQRALNEAKDFAGQQYHARIDSHMQSIVVAEAGHYKLLDFTKEA